MDQIIAVSDNPIDAADDMDGLVESSFGGAEAQSVLRKIAGPNEGEWKADRMQRKLSQHIYEIEKELDLITIIFYEDASRLQHANSAENGRSPPPDDHEGLTGWKPLTIIIGCTLLLGFYPGMDHRRQ